MRRLMICLLFCQLLCADYLNNGFDYRITENEKAKISVILKVNVGFLQEFEDQAGMAHFVEHIVFQEDEMESLGLELSHTDAFTSMDSTLFEIETSADNLDCVLSLLGRVVEKAEFDEAIVEREREIVLEEVREKLKDPYLKRIREIAEILLGEKVQQFPPGNLRVIETCSRQKIWEFYHQWYRPDRMVLCIEGNVDKKELKESVERKFGQLILPHEESHFESKVFSKAKSTPIVIQSNDGLPMVSIAMLLPFDERIELENTETLYEEGVILSHWCTQFRLTEGYNFFECGAVLRDANDAAVVVRRIAKNLF